MWTSDNKVGIFVSEQALQDALNSVTFPASWTVLAKGYHFALVAIDGVFIP